ncbi:MAG: VRR-NUC domain-containing protein [Acidobacteria bacterium Pan2503]|uniref:VRR-NUC domain-containing protein n=1 Tax=Candidatus Acidiferrum panamense TaxID=2741543 RepID=A0A7V8NUZ0_9BACT|nr:VRR-NUC domain-containing protein [Candidatus Acidoferrum panamensis]
MVGWGVAERLEGCAWEILQSITPPRCPNRTSPTRQTVKVSEADLHRSVADLLDWILLPPALWTTFPAGWGKLGKATAGRLRGAGLKAGFPDLFIFFSGRATGIELKAEGGQVSKKQTAMFLRLYEAGVRVYICKNTDDVIGVLEQESLPHRKVGQWSTSEPRSGERPSTIPQGVSPQV